MIVLYTNGQKKKKGEKEKEEKKRKKKKKKKKKKKGFVTMMTCFTPGIKGMEAIPFTTVSL